LARGYKATNKNIIENVMPKDFSDPRSIAAWLIISDIKEDRI